MKVTTILLLLSTFALGSISAAALEPAKSAHDLRPAVFLIVSASENTCATAFLNEQGDLVSALHVIKSMCSYDACDGIRLYRVQALAPQSREQVTYSSLKLRYEIPVHDLGFLEVTWPNDTVAPIRLEKVASSPSVGDPVYSLGFPACGTLELNAGRITSANDLWLNLSVKGKHGSSGSPVFDQHLNLIGVMHQISSPLSASASAIFGTSASMRATRYERSLVGNYEKQAALLLSFYKQDLRQLTGLNRFFNGASFISGVDALSESILKAHSNPQFERVLSFRNEYPGSIWDYYAHASTSDLLAVTPLDELALAYSLEVSGPFVRLLRPLKIEQLLSKLRSIPLSNEKLDQIQAILDQSRARKPYQGFHLYALKLAFYAALITLACVSAWAFSLGYVFRALKGGFLSKVLITLSVALIAWPISLFIFCLYQRKKN